MNARHLLHLLIIALVGCAIALSPTYEGFAARYAPGLFERVARHRGMEPAACMLASPRHEIGAWVRGVRTGIERMCQVADTSAPRDRARHLRTRLFELDYESARAICGQVTGPNRDCPVRVTALPFGGGG